MTDQQIIDVVKAHQEGKAIQFKSKEDASPEWQNVYSVPCWGFNKYDYRIKPEPKVAREWWIHPKMFPDCEYEKDRILTEKPINLSWIHVREVLEDA